MPTLTFNPRQRVILVEALAIAVDGRPADLTVLIDTGAGQTGFRRSILIGLGIDVDSAAQTMQINTASGSLDVPVVNLPHLSIFGESFSNLPALAFQCRRLFLPMEFWAMMFCQGSGFS